MANLLRRLANSAKIRTGKDIEPTRFLNKDVVPVPIEKRTYTGTSFAAYWAVTGVNASAWALGSSNIANGLSPAQAIGGVLIGSVIAGAVAFLCGEPGVQFHVGFPLVSRAAFGIYGSYFVILIKIFVNFIFFGVQAFWGGQAIRVILAALSPSYMEMRNSLPVSAQVETGDLMGLMVYMIIFLPLLFVPPHKLKILMHVSFVTVTATMLGTFIWALVANRGLGDLVKTPGAAISRIEAAFRMFQCISSVGGSWIGNCIHQSDWTRFAKTKRAPAIAQLVSAPLTITITAMVGVFVTSATQQIYGKTVWQPIQLLLYIQKENYTPAMRVCSFLAGSGWFISQLSINLVHNSVAAGMDLASLLPQYITVFRGALLMAVVGIVINPWRFVNAPGTFINVLSSFGLFTAPLAGVLIVDFWIVRRRNWNIPDLYVNVRHGSYWFWKGLHWRAFVAWLLAVWPSLPGFIAETTAGTDIASGWIRMFQLTFLLGLVVSALVYWLLCVLVPIPQACVNKPFMNSHETDGDREGRELEERVSARRLEGVE